jgi:uncharacterized protein YndB with AHSA1/START domain
MAERSVTHATFSIERVYDAAPARVFKAWSDPKARDRWFVAADGWKVSEYSHDFRVGGREVGRFSQTGKNIYTNDTHYQDIVPDNRIIFAYTMAKDGENISASVATVELKPEGKRTRLIYTEQGAFLDGLDTPASREAGWHDLLSSLGKEFTPLSKSA